MKCYKATELMKQVFWDGVDWEVLESHFEMVTTELRLCAPKRCHSEKDFREKHFRHHEKPMKRP